MTKASKNSKLTDTVACPRKQVLGLLTFLEEIMSDYLDMMRQSMKMAGMSDDMIEQALEAQKATLAAYGTMDQQVQAALAGQAAALAGQVQAAGQDLGVNMDSYFEFAEKPSINKAYQWAVACGADLIHLRADIINDLSTGTDKETILEILSEQWGIDTKEDFIEMAESLKKGRHSKVYQKLAAGEAVADFEDEAENLKEAKKVFKKEKLIGTEVPNLLIWDIARLINICRFAFDGKLIDRKAALSYLKEAALLVKKNYHSWKELSTAYQFGRAVWGGLEEFEEMKEGMEQLLTEKDSPWLSLSFDMELNFEEKI
jgi:hypothetical protein